MRYLVDTSVLARLANAEDAQHPLASSAIERLYGSGAILQVTGQVLVEFRNAATRPREVNGLGLAIEEVSAKSAKFEAMFPLLEETPAIFPAWKALVGQAGVIGKQVHDARLVAVCHAHGVTHLLTFNSAHFARLAGFGPGLVVVHPADA